MNKKWMLCLFLFPVFNITSAGLFRWGRTAGRAVRQNPEIVREGFRRTLRVLEQDTNPRSGTIRPQPRTNSSLQTPQAPNTPVSHNLPSARVYQRPTNNFNLPPVQHYATHITNQPEQIVIDWNFVRDTLQQSNNVTLVTTNEPNNTVTADDVSDHYNTIGTLFLDQDDSSELVIPAHTHTPRIEELSEDGSVIAVTHYTETEEEPTAYELVSQAIQNPMLQAAALEVAATAGPLMLAARGNRGALRRVPRPGALARVQRPGAMARYQNPETRITVHTPRNHGPLVRRPQTNNALAVTQRPGAMTRYQNPETRITMRPNNRAVTVRRTHRNRQPRNQNVTTQVVPRRRLLHPGITGPHALNAVRSTLADNTTPETEVTNHTLPPIGTVALPEPEPTQQPEQETPKETAQDQNNTTEDRDTNDSLEDEPNEQDDNEKESSGNNNNDKDKKPLRGHIPKKEEPNSIPTLLAPTPRQPFMGPRTVSQNYNARPRAGALPAQVVGNSYTGHVHQENNVNEKDRKESDRKKRTCSGIGNQQGGSAVITRTLRPCPESARYKKVTRQQRIKQTTNPITRIKHASTNMIDNFATALKTAWNKVTSLLSWS